MINAGMLGVGMQMIGGLAGAFATDQQGAIDEAYANYQADVDALNAKISRMTQQDILEQGQVQIGDFTRQVGEAVADDIVAQASSGLIVSEDSVNAIMRMGARQTEQLRKGIEDDAFAAGLEGLSLDASAAGKRASGAAKRSAARTTALTSGIGTIGSGITKLDKLGAFKKSTKSTSSLVEPGPKSRAKGIKGVNF